VRVAVGVWVTVGGMGVGEFVGARVAVGGMGVGVFDGVRVAVGGMGVGVFVGVRVKVGGSVVWVAVFVGAKLVDVRVAVEVSAEVVGGLVGDGVALASLVGVGFRVRVGVGGCAWAVWLTAKLVANAKRVWLASCCATKVCPAIAVCELAAA
jgi:hypothetical protein